ncbi:cob(I)yrinic acid a,c-diamide adenosyltransferase [Microgenomates group bacterium]|nr:cob(I)yrinic acid a,c-diamide adenosyltransferase [Microgenomates group bacterium]
MSIKQGLVYVFTGEGKGKTSAALGVAVRAVCSGMKVGWVSWYKEKVLATRLDLVGLEMYAMGKGFYKLPGDNASLPQHKSAAKKALELAKKLMKTVDVLILDEVNNAVKDKLISLKQITNLINKRGKTHLILTGRGASGSVLDGADLVTEMKKIKHPFDKGIKAVRGLDY